MKIFKYFLLYLFIYIILFIISPWILKLINITITLPWSIIEEDIITYFGLNLNPTADNIFYRRIIHFTYGSISLVQHQWKVSSKEEITRNGLPDTDWRDL